MNTDNTARIIDTEPDLLVEGPGVLKKLLLVQ